MSKKRTDDHLKNQKRKPEKGRMLELAVDTLDEDGYGVATHEGIRIRVVGALPGEQVRARVTFSGQRDIFAETKKILRHSPERLAQVLCPEAESCNGCPLIQMKYKAQLAWKHSLVEKAVRRYPSLRKTPILPVAASKKPLAYRTTAKLVISGRFAEPKIGIYQRNTHQVIDIGDCPLHHPLINRIVAAAREGIRKGKVPVYSPTTRNGIMQIGRASCRERVFRTV